MRQNMSSGFRHSETQTSVLGFRDKPEIEKCTCSKLEMINNKGADQSVRMRRLVCAFCCSATSKTGFLALRPINNAGLLSFYIDMSVIVNVTQLYLEDLTCVLMHFKAYQTS